MALSFEALPADTLLPLFYAEVTSASEPVSTNLTVCLIGHMNKTGFSPGSGVANWPYLVSRNDATALFGRGSMLEGMYDKARQNSRWTQIWCIAIPEALDATQGVGTITVGLDANAARSGNMTFFIAGHSVTVGVRSTDLKNAIAANIAARINALGLAVKATVALNVVTVTVKWGGFTGNDIIISYVGPHGRREAQNKQVRLARLLVAFVQPSGGSGEFEPASTFAALDSRKYDVFVMPYTSTALLDSAEIFMNKYTGRWSPANQLYGHFVTCIKGTYAALNTFALARNDPHMTTLGIWKSCIPGWEWSAALGAVMAAHWGAPPELSRPLQSLPLIGCFVGTDDDESFLPTEREVLLEDGLTTFHVDDDTTCRIDRVRTMRKTNDLTGDPDAAWSDAITMFQAMYFVRAMRAAIAGAFPRAALTTRPSGIPGFASPALIKIVIINEYRRLQALGLVENSDLFAQYLIVQRDEIDRNRVNALLRPDFVNQLCVIATIVETHLELSANDPLLAAAAA